LTLRVVRQRYSAAIEMIDYGAAAPIADDGSDEDDGDEE
jgi:hypothetical protein